MNFYKNIKTIVVILFMLILAANIIMYFFIPNNVIVFGNEINCIYIQIIFLLLEVFMLSMIYGKKRGLTFCLVYMLLVVINLIFLFANLV